MKVKAKDSKEEILKRKHLIEKILKPYNLPLKRLVAVDNYDALIDHFQLQDLAHEAPNKLLKKEYYTDEEFEELMSSFEKKTHDDDDVLTITGFFRPGNGRIQPLSLQNILSFVGL